MLEKGQQALQGANVSKMRDRPFDKLRAGSDALEGTIALLWGGSVAVQVGSVGG